MPSLRRYLSAAGRRGFAWGENDCVLFAAGWVAQVTGRDPSLPWRGTYQTPTQARAVLQRQGGLSKCIEGALEQWACVDPNTTKPGDIVLVDLPDHDDQAVGIAADRGRVALLTRKGLVVAPVPVLRAWRHG